MTGEVLPTWDEASTSSTPTRTHGRRTWCGSAARPTCKGIIAPAADADRAVRYLTKYLTKAIAEAHTDTDGARPGVSAPRRPAPRRAALPTVLAGLRELAPLRRPAHERRTWSGARPLRPTRRTIGRTSAAAGAVVLVSRQWSGKTLAEHKADRAAVVREALRGRRHRRTTSRPPLHRGARRRRAAALRLGRSSGDRCRLGHGRRSQRHGTPPLASAVRASACGPRTRSSPCGQRFGNCSIRSLT